MKNCSRCKAKSNTLVQDIVCDKEMSDIEKMCKEVQNVLLTEDSVEIRLNTIKHIALLMRKNGAVVTASSLYLHFTQYGIESLVIYDKSII